MAKITVKDKDITVVKVNDEDYLSLTDMLKAKDGDFFITDWLRNRNTLEYIGIWEQVYNPDSPAAIHSKEIIPSKRSARGSKASA